MGENDTTPVAALQELAVKGGFRKPYYELMSQSIGSDTDTSRFQCLVTAAGIKASGSGWSKQTSKNQAAQRVLMKMGIEVPYETPATFFFKMASRASEEALKREKMWRYSARRADQPFTICATGKDFEEAKRKAIADSLKLMDVMKI